MKVYRLRRRPLRRFAREFAASSAVGLMIYLFPVSEGIWRVLYPAVATLFASYLWHVMRALRKKETRTIRVFRDRVSWQGDGNRSFEARFGDVFDLIPDRARPGYQLRTTQGVLRIHPEIEGYTDLRRRLEPSRESALAKSKVTWAIGTSFRFRTSPHLRLGLLSIFLGLWLFFAASVGTVPLGVPLLIGVALTFCFGIHTTLFAPMARIEIRDGELIRFGWRGQIGEPTRLSSIVGACTERGLWERIGIIDTDRGEVRFSMGLEGAEDLVREADRLGALRLAKERAGGSGNRGDDPLHAEAEAEAVRQARA